jgi:hypothetical protein
MHSVSQTLYPAELFLWTLLIDVGLQPVVRYDNSRPTAFQLRTHIAERVYSDLTVCINMHKLLFDVGSVF